MRVWKIVDIKNFMSKLLVGTMFDEFLMREASVSTYNTFLIEGKLHMDFYDTQKQEEFASWGQAYSCWREDKNFVFSIIKGKRTPLSFKIVFLLSKSMIEEILREYGLHITYEEIGGLYLNILYDGTNLTCTTGCSRKSFSMDRTLDQAWDDWAEDFLRKWQVPTETL